MVQSAGELDFILHKVFFIRNSHSAFVSRSTPSAISRAIHLVGEERRAAKGVRTKMLSNFHLNILKLDLCGAAAASPCGCKLFCCGDNRPQMRSYSTPWQRKRWREREERQRRRNSFLCRRFEWPRRDKSCFFRPFRGSAGDDLRAKPNSQMRSSPPFHFQMKINGFFPNAIFSSSACAPPLASRSSQHFSFLPVPSAPCDLHDAFSPHLA